MRISRRTMFKIGGVAGASAIVGRASEASASVAAPRGDTPAVLVDTTRCIGCRGCEAACSEANRLAEPAGAGEEAVFDTRRTTSPAVFTVVNRFNGPEGSPVRFVKSQCMHCVDPACASACLARALEKTPAGPVVYHGDRCLGCRYCMLACPFDVPKFEYESATPFVRKCGFCAERQARGLEPACTSVCPSGALTFGKRDALIEEARMRIYQNPGKYERHIYGEHEAGGTSWLYISDRPLAQLGFKTDVPKVAYGSLTQPALAAVPFIITLWPPLLMALHSFSQRRENGHDDHEGPWPGPATHDETEEVRRA